MYNGYLGSTLCKVAVRVAETHALLVCCLHRQVCSHVRVISVISGSSNVHFASHFPGCAHGSTVLPAHLVTINLHPRPHQPSQTPNIRELCLQLVLELEHVFAIRRIPRSFICRIYTVLARASMKHHTLAEPDSEELS